VVAFAIWRLQPSPDLATRELARFALPPPPHLRFAGGPVISPDGTLVVFPAGEGPTDKQRCLSAPRSADDDGTAGHGRGVRALLLPDGKS
jgi:hypothetical protein